MDLNPLIACRDCDRIHRHVAMPAGSVAWCTRCGAPLYHFKGAPLDRNLALCLGGLILFAVANVFPLLSFELQGQVRQVTLLSAVTAMADAGRPLVALGVMFTCWVMPLLTLLGTLWVILPFHLGLRPWKAALVFRLTRVFQSWSMLEVLLLGVLISYVKLGKQGIVLMGPSCFALGALMVLMAASTAGLDAEAVWERIGGRAYPVPRAHAGAHVSCHACRLVLPEGPPHCPRCGAGLHRRKPGSLGRTWALLVAAALLFIPANLMPVMRTSSLGDTQANTILSGVLFFMREGSWGLALIIFIASILVPLAKLFTLAFLLVSVHRGSRWRPEDRTRLYLLTEMVGRWSMVDIYVIALMVTLVQMGSLAVVEPGAGATAFTAVVILTLFAAENFDPRLIWDALEEPRV